MSGDAVKIIQRYFTKVSMLPEKLQEIMLKIRKGATSGITWKQLQEVFAILGPEWKLIPINGLVKACPGDFDNYVEGDKASIEKIHDEMLLHAVHTLPSNPKPGQLYLKDLTPVKQFKQSGFQDRWFIEATPWVGCEGWKIVADEKILEVFPTWTAFGRMQFKFEELRYKLWKRGKLHIPWNWLTQETNFISTINNKLNMGEHIPTAQRTREDTGTCPVCFKNVKASPHIALHGYKRPGFGETVGSCWGVGHLPFEVSVEGTENFLERSIKPQLTEAHKKLQDIDSGKIEKLSLKGRLITPDNSLWKMYLEEFRFQIERNITSLQKDEKIFEILVKNWKQRPLPKEGEPHISWYDKTLKGL